MAVYLRVSSVFDVSLRSETFDVRSETHRQFHWQPQSSPETISKLTELLKMWIWWWRWLQELRAIRYSCKDVVLTRTKLTVIISSWSNSLKRILLAEPRDRCSLRSQKLPRMHCDLMSFSHQTSEKMMDGPIKHLIFLNANYLIWYVKFGFYC